MDTIIASAKVVSAIWAGLMLFVFMLGGNGSDEDDRFSAYVLFASMSAFPVALHFGAEGAATGMGLITWGFPFLSYVGFGLIVIGLSIQFTGVFQLGKFWTATVDVSKGHQLINQGIFHYIRHPIYLAIMMELLGLGLSFANWISLAVFVLPNAAAFAYRIHVEESALLRHFGAQYADYSRHTKRLIPGIF